MQAEATAMRYVLLVLLFVAGCASAKPAAPSLTGPKPSMPAGPVPTTMHCPGSSAIQGW